MSALIDLHTHSHHSDGTLAPAALAQMAAARGVRVLALTDHDTIAGLDECASTCRELGIEPVSGVEVTALWRGQEIHVVGLGIDPGAAPLVQHLRTLLQARRERIAEIGRRLQRVPALRGEDAVGTVLAGSAVPTRTHVARALVDLGMAEGVQEAFDRWLGRGKKGYVPPAWPTLEAAVAAIVAARGHAVLAHPHRYKLSAGALRALVADFAACGGAALEVSLPNLGDEDAVRLASLARQHGLAGSSGSDFHEPGLPWRPLGRFAKLPEGTEPLVGRLVQIQVE